MKNKLELKHLAPYLPYDLKMQITHSFGFIETRTLSLDCGHDFNLHLSKNSVKLILRQLSDLTKEIEVNGIKFVPNDLLNSRFRRSSKDLLPYKNTPYNLELDIQTENYSQSIDLFDGYLIVNELLEWHFDIFGLIEQGLAISIHDVKQSTTS